MLGGYISIQSGYGHCEGWEAVDHTGDRVVGIEGGGGGGR